MPKSEDHSYDYIVLKVPLHQNIGGGSTSKRVRREPNDPNRWDLALRMLKEPIIFELEKDTRWCPHCGETRSVKMFSKDLSRKDGLRDWCKSCCAADERRRYWLKKDSDAMWQAWHRRHILRIESVETEIQQAA